MDRLSIFIVAFVLFLAAIITGFSKKFMKGDALYDQFFQNLFKTSAFFTLANIADNLVLCLICWFLCHHFVIKAMTHNPRWPAAQASGKQAQQTFNLGFFFLVLSFFSMYCATDTWSIQNIIVRMNSGQEASLLRESASVFLVLAAMSHLAVWPFHRWVINGLNSPTPVVALIHGIVISGGIFLLVRFAPIYSDFSHISAILLIFGIISIVIGGGWKIIQHDVKRMVACSTIEHMGFALLLCGMGLQSMALGHVCCHGIVKVFAFLGSDSLALEARPPALTHNSATYGLGLFCGVFSISLFLIWPPLFCQGSARIIAGAMIFMASTDIVLLLLGNDSLKRLPLAIGISAIGVMVYRANLCFFDWIFPAPVIQNKTMESLSFGVIAIIGLFWLASLFLRYRVTARQWPDWLLGVYVAMLNNSQPNPETITAQRKGYDCVSSTINKS